MNIAQIILWICFAAFSIPSFIFGFRKIILQKEMIIKFHNWGYHTYFMWLIGLIEMVISIAVLFTTTRNGSLYIYFILLIGALYTHIKAKDSKKDTMAPIFVFLLSTIIFIFSNYFL